MKALFSFGKLYARLLERVWLHRNPIDPLTDLERYQGLRTPSLELEMLTPPKDGIWRKLWKWKAH